MGEQALFVPGRLCLAGEHSDWAATYRTQCPAISPGAALVVGLQQGLHARIMWTDANLTLSSELAGVVSLPDACLLPTARSASPWRFAAAVGHVINTRHNAIGLNLRITSATLPAGKGLSSSAAVCVLVARAFNVLHKLRLTHAGEMDIAYAAERLTGSACGRMDQVVAIGPGRVARMEFDGEYVEHRVLRLPEQKAVHAVLADLGAGKDTKAILAGLHRGFPDRTDQNADLQDTLGMKNLKLITEMEGALLKGDACGLGRLFTIAQERFDAAAISFCPEELSSPKLHTVLKDPDVLSYTYGGKGVGSQGDGAVQFVAKDYESALLLKEVLNKKLGTNPIIVNIGHEPSPVHSNDQSLEPVLSASEIVNKVRTAVIPAAGFGTRLFPASRSIRPKALFPIVDADGFAKPLLLHLVEQCAEAGIERIFIVVGPGEQEERVREIFLPVPKDLHLALKPHMREYADQIVQLASRIQIVVQREPNGFGDAVACAQVEEESPFALLLGDVVFKSSCTEKSCLQQAVEAFEKDSLKSVIGVTEVPVSEAGAYGTVKIFNEDRVAGTRMAIHEIVEKPNMAKAEEHSINGKCSIVLGPYIFTPALMRELRMDVLEGKKCGGEIQLTPAMERMLHKEGMDALRLDGEALDTGNAADYAQTLHRLRA